MTKNELFKRMWVDISKRRPENTEEQYLYKMTTGIVNITTGLVICARFEEEKSKPRENKYRITHWIKVIV